MKPIFQKETNRQDNFIKIVCLYGIMLKASTIELEVELVTGWVGSIGPNSSSVLYKK